MKPKYSSSDLSHLVCDLIADWDSWIVSPLTRVGLVTEAFDKSDVSESRGLREILRQRVNYTGNAHDSAHSLYAELDGYARISLDGFIASLMDVFQGRLDANNSHEQTLGSEVDEIRVKY